MRGIVILEQIIVNLRPVIEDIEYELAYDKQNEYCFICVYLRPYVKR